MKCMPMGLARFVPAVFMVVPMAALLMGGCQPGETSSATGTTETTATDSSGSNTTTDATGSESTTGGNGNSNAGTQTAGETIELVGIDFSTTSVTHAVRLNGSATGATIRSMQTVNAGPLGVPNDPHQTDLTQQYKSIGVTMVRTHDLFGPLDMATVYPDVTADPSLDASYNFATSDPYYQAIVSGGFDVYLRVGDSAGFNTGFTEPSPRAPSDHAHFAAAAVKFVQHYTDSTLWGRNPVRYVEIWNEPDSSSFWDSTRDSFFDLFGQTAIALKAAYPTMKIGGPGVTGASYEAPLGQQWFAAFLSYCRAHSVPLDFLSWHTYSNDPQHIADAAAWYRTQLDAHGYTATESHLTEWNTDTHGASAPSPGSAEGLTLRAGGRGAALVTAGWMSLQDSDVSVAAFYRGRDPETDHSELYGLMSSAGVMKRSGLAFALWGQMSSTYSTRMSVTVKTSSSTTLYALAGRASDGSVAVLLANASDQSVGCQFPDNSGYVQVRRVSDGASVTQVGYAATSGLSVPAYSVALVVIAAH